jgi:DNA-binding NarL/FixJ family response regulator
MHSPTSSRVFVVEDHPMFRQAVVELLSREPRYEVVGQANSAATTRAALGITPADAVMLDITLEGTDGLELIKHLRAEHPNVRILVLTMHDEDSYALRALRAGAHGYLTKRATGEVLLQALDQVLRGEIYVSENFGRKLITHAVQANWTDAGDPLARVSDRELEVLQLVGEGRSTREIADHLRLSVKTVETHRLNLRDKLKLENSAELVRYAIEWRNSREAV